MPQYSGTKSLGALNAALTLDWPGGSGKVSIQRDSGLTGTTILEVSQDGGTEWTALQGKKGTDGTAATNITAADVLSADLVAATGTKVRARVSAYTSGAADHLLTVAV
jgi:putative NADH-flavin reductase